MRNSPMAFVLALLSLFLLVSGAIDSKEESQSHAVYCQMVDLWEEEAKLGIDPEYRKGWPPFDGACNG